LDLQQLGQVLLFLPIFLFSVIIHEISHGLVALWHGDPTAKFAGRLTLNPIPHLDPLGSILLPGMLLLTGSRFLFGWAKPVPVNENNLRHPRNDGFKVAAAGPLSNILLAYACALLLSLGMRVFPNLPEAAVVLLGTAIGINCLLAVFNLLPIPPLDGHWLLMRFLPPRLAMAYRRVGFLGVAVIFLLFLIPSVQHVLVRVPVNFLATLLLGAAGVPGGWS
jgi:Zn-dependent protease